MTVLVRFVSDYAHYMYGACALIALWYLRVAIIARRERRRAIFSLEREAALQRIYSTWGVAFFLMLVMGVVYFVGNTLNEALPPPEITLLPTATPNGTGVPNGILDPTPTPTAEPATATPTITPTRPTPRPSPTAPPTPPTVEGTPAPTNTPAPQVSAPLCGNPNARLTAPGVGTTRRGPIQVVGTANIDSFQRYFLEFRSTGEAGFHYITGGESPVVDGVLGVWDTSGLAAGNYILQLVVVDVTGNYPTPCQTQVTVP